MKKITRIMTMKRTSFVDGLTILLSMFSGVTKERSGDIEEREEKEERADEEEENCSNQFN